MSLAEDLAQRYSCLIRFSRLHTSWVSDLVFSPDGSLLASCGADRVVFIINVADRLPLCCVELEHPIYVSSLLWPLPGLLVLGRSDGAVQMVTVDLRKVRQPLLIDWLYTETSFLHVLLP